MPWEKRGEGFTTKRGGFVRNPGQYEKLRSKGMSKGRAAAIVNKSMFEIEKKKQNTDSTGAATTAAGGTIAGVGLVGGGIPGVKSDPESIKRIKRGTTPQRIKASVKSGRGGIFGYRADAHQSFHAKEAKAWAKDRVNADPSHIDSYLKGMRRGKLASERTIIRGMKAGRLASHGALAGGLGLAAYGVHRTGSHKVSKKHIPFVVNSNTYGLVQAKKKLQGKQQVSKAKSDTDRYHGALAGAGGTLAGAGVLGARKLEHEGRKWSQVSADKITEAARIAPNTGLYRKKKGPNKRVPDVVPDYETHHMQSDPYSRLHGDKAVVHQAGKLRGEATQARYFARTFGTSANMARKAGLAGAAVGAVGVGGLALSHRKKVKKSIESPLTESVFSKAKQDLTPAERGKVRRMAGAGVVGGLSVGAPNTAILTSGAIAGVTSKKGKRYSAGWRAAGRTGVEGAGGALGGALLGGLTRKPAAAVWSSKLGRAAAQGHGHYASTRNSQRKGWQE